MGLFRTLLALGAVGGTAALVARRRQLLDLRGHTVVVTGGSRGASTSSSSPSVLRLNDSAARRFNEAA